MRTKADACATSGKSGSAACRVLQLGQAVGGGRGDRMLGIDQRAGQRAAASRPVELAERHRRLLAHAGIRIGQHRRPDSGTAAGSPESASSIIATRRSAGIGGLQPLGRCLRGRRKLSNGSHAPCGITAAGREC